MWSNVSQQGFPPQPGGAMSGGAVPPSQPQQPAQNGIGPSGMAQDKPGMPGMPARPGTPPGAKISQRDMTHSYVCRVTFI